MSLTWLHLALLSGASAAFNGFFAKLTMGSLAPSLSAWLAQHLSLPSDSVPLEYTVRGVFFAFNMLFDSVMWGLFTAALAKGSSATSVSIVNTSANFLVAAMLGWMVFAERLPGMWWIGAGLLVAGNFVVGRGGKEQEDGDREEYAPLALEEEVGERGSGEAAVPLEGELRARTGHTPSDDDEEEAR